MNLKVSLACVVLLHAGCAPRPVVPLLERDPTPVHVPDDGLTPYYIEAVNAGRRHLREGRLPKAEAYFIQAMDLPLFEVPNYEIWLELAEVQCRLGKASQGLELIDKFDVALRVDFGEIPCFSSLRRADEEVPNSDVPERVFSELCSEFVFLYDLQYASTAERQEIESNRKRFERESVMLRARCADLSQ